MSLIKFISFLFLIPLAVAAARAEGNIVSNPSFEEVDASGFPLGWSGHIPVVPSDNPMQLVPGDAQMFGTDLSTEKSGSRSLRISSTDLVRLSMAQYLPFKAGQKLRLSAWIKGEGLAMDPKQGAWIRLAFLNSDPAIQQGMVAQQGFLKSTESTFDWTLFSTEVTVPAGAQTMPLECYLWQSKGTAWFDDVSVEVIDGPPNDPALTTDPANKTRYHEANVQLPPPGKDEKRVVFIGDSITDNWKLDTFFPGEGFINRGIGGQNTAQIFARFPDDALALQPKVIWLLAGTNDLAGGVPSEAIVANIRAMVRLSHERHIKIIVCSLLPTSDYHQDKSPRFARTAKRPLDKIIAINQELAAMCQQEMAIYLDLFSHVVDTSGRMTADYSEDGLHPNKKGYTVLAPTVLAAINAAKD